MAPQLPPDTSVPAVRIARDLAKQIWRGNRSAAPWGVHGLNSEGAVRGRLTNAVQDILKQPSITADVTVLLHRIDLQNDDPLSILEKSEALVDLVFSRHFGSVDELVVDGDHLPRLVVRLLLVQSIAGRLGQWAVRSDEIPDARTARAITSGIVTPDWSQYCALVDRGAQLFEQTDMRGAANAYLAADRLVRTPIGLIHASACLCHVADYVGALWAIRACLLEPEPTFESDAALSRARTLETRLGELVESRQREPLDSVESKLVENDTPAPPAFNVQVRAYEPPAEQESRTAPLAARAQPPAATERRDRSTVERATASYTEDDVAEPLPLVEAELVSESQDADDVLNAKTQETPHPHLTLVATPSTPMLRRVVVNDVWGSRTKPNLAHAESTRRLPYQIREQVRFVSSIDALPEDVRTPTPRELELRDDDDNVVMLIADTFDREFSEDDVADDTIEGAENIGFEEETDIPPVDVLRMLRSQRSLDLIDQATEQVAFEVLQRFADQPPMQGRIADTAEIDVPPKRTPKRDQRSEKTQLIRALRRNAFEKTL